MNQWSRSTSTQIRPIVQFSANQSILSKSQRHPILRRKVASSLSLGGPQVVALAEEFHLPAIYLFRQFAPGGLVVYGPNLPDLFRRAGTYVDKILKGAFRSAGRAADQVRSRDQPEDGQSDWHDRAALATRPR
jgi:hypothetical protein